MAAKKLQEYEKKRDLRKTPEPQAEGPDGGDGPLFAVQQHDAASMHWDLRLEVDGVLKSWAVPKGPSTDPDEQRLAVPTEDHPLAYAGFEGVIPEDEYGGGAVIVWDRGSYRNLTENDDGEEVPMAEAIDGGHLKIRLAGEKISGGYALNRMQSGDDEKWLLVKLDDEEADARRDPVSTERESVLSGRTVEEVAEEEGPERDG